MVSATSSANHNRPKPPTKPEAMNVEIRGLCPSACTLVLAHVPKERLCFSQTAVLAFHLARFPNGEPTIEGSLAMFNAYPRDIRSKRCPLKAFGSYSHPSCGGWAIGDVRRWAQCLSTCRVWRSSYGRSTRRNPCGRSTRRNPWGGIRAKRDTRQVVEPGRCLFMGTAPG